MGLQSLLLAITTLNVDGLGAGDKLDDVGKHLASYHIAFLVESRTRDVSGLARQLSGHDVYQVPATTQGRKGQGVVVCVCVSRAIRDFTRVHALDRWPGCIWLELQVNILGVQHPVYIGGVYVRPEQQGSNSMSDHQPEQVLADLGVLCKAIREFREQGAEVLLCGDFHAHLNAHLHQVIIGNWEGKPPKCAHNWCRAGNYVKQSPQTMQAACSRP